MTKSMPFELVHIGGEKCVTGSCHYLKFDNNINMMVDCGAVMGSDNCISLKKYANEIQKMKYLFITHAHIDHIGRIPELINLGFCGEILCTHATKKLMIPMLEDALSFENIGKFEKEDILGRIDELSWGLEYNEKFYLPGTNISFKFKNAGHILGSAFIEFEILCFNNKSYFVIFSGDLGKKDTPLVCDPDMPCACDLVVLESTYGNRVHSDYDKKRESLGKIINKAVKDSGKIIIPAFSLGRIQEIIYDLDCLISQNLIKQAIPVFIDSPLGIKITEIYSQLKDFWDEEAVNKNMKGNHPLNFNHLYSVENYKSHKELVHFDKPAIVAAGSGMCTGGRVVDHIDFCLEDFKNDIVFVGYQAKGTLGNDIIRYSSNGDGYVFVNGEKRYVRADIHFLSGYSAHADKNGLIDFVKSVPGKFPDIKLVHGDTGAVKSLSDDFLKLGYFLL